MSKVNDDDLEGIVPRFEGMPYRYDDYSKWKEIAHRFADRYAMELNQIIVGKLNQEDRLKYYELIEMNYDILLYILFKPDVLERPAVFPHFYPVYDFLRSKIPDIYEIGQTLRKDIANDFPI